jgi:hypothetical protein
MAPLQVTRIAGFGKKPPQSFSQSPVILGTGAGSSVRFDPAWDKGVAPQHVRVEWIHNYWSLSDMGSPAGTWIGGRKITQAVPITEPVEIELGKGGPRCRVEPLAESTRPPAPVGTSASPTPARQPAPVRPRQPASGPSAPILAVVVLLVGAGAAWYFLDKKSTEPSDATAASKVTLPPQFQQTPPSPNTPPVPNSGPVPEPTPTPAPSPQPSPSPQSEPTADHPFMPSALPDGDDQAVGARRLGLEVLTPEQQGVARRHFPSAAGVRLNQIGVDRLRSNSFAVEAPAAPMGDEIVTRKAGSTTYANGDAEADDVTPNKLPVAVDNSTRPTFPGVGDQLGLNSCASFSSVFYAASNNLAVARGLNAPVLLSPMWTYTMVNGGENEGSTIEAVYLMLQNHGAPPIEMMPYPDETRDPQAETENVPPKYFRPWATDPAVWRAALLNRVGEIGTFDALDTPAGLQRLKAYLANGYLANYSTQIENEDKPVSHQGWTDNWGVAKSNPALSAEGNAAAGQPVLCCVGACHGGHAMTIVGYNDDVWIDYNNDGIVQPEEKGALKIVNSWGKDHFPRKKDGGFAWISYDALRDHSQFPWIEQKDRIPAIDDKRAWYMLPGKTEEKRPFLAQFTLSNAHRDEVDVRLGVSTTSQREPELIWRPAAITTTDFESRTRLSVDTAMGGPYAFDGGNQEMEGTFVFDPTDVIVNYKLPADGDQTYRFYLIVTDLKTGNPTTVSDFRITDGDGKPYAVAGGLPQTVDKDKLMITLDTK